MRYVEHPPPAPWRRLVRCLWTLEAGSELLGAPPQRVLPDGRLEIVVHVRDPFHRIDPSGQEIAPRRAVVAGQMTRSMTLRASGATECLGVRLEPAGARALLRMPLGGLEDEILPLEDVLGADGRRLAEAVGEAPNALSRLRATWTWVRERLSAPPVPTIADAAVLRWRRDGGSASVEAVAAAVGLSRRQLERSFRSDVGVRPKRFARILRLQRVARELRADPGRGLAAGALAGGFCDQAHLTREFSDLVGVSPARWLEEEDAVAAAFLGDGEPDA